MSKFRIDIVRAFKLHILDRGKRFPDEIATSSKSRRTKCLNVIFQTLRNGLCFYTEIIIDIQTRGLKQNL